MSYILEALKKAQAERQLGATPDVHAPTIDAYAVRQAQRPAWLPAALGGALAVAALGLTLWWRQGTPAVTQPQAGLPAPATAGQALAAGSAPVAGQPGAAPSMAGSVPSSADPLAATQAQAARPPEAPAQFAPPSAALAPATQVTQVTQAQSGQSPAGQAAALAPAGQAQAGRTAAAQVATAQPPADRAPAAPPSVHPLAVAQAQAPAAQPSSVRPPAVPPSAARQPAAPLSAPATAATAPSTPIPANTVAAHQGAAPVKPAAAPEPQDEFIPAARDLPEPIQRILPTVAMSGYMYSKNPADRLVLIDKALRREGDEVAPGLILERLQPKGAVFTFRGYRYRVPY